MDEVKCPTCGSQEVISIVYGYPSGDQYDELMGKHIKGEIFLGGCCIFESIEKMSSKHCKVCQMNF